MNNNRKMLLLKAMVAKWKREKSLTLAYDIAEFLANNLNLDEQPKAELISENDGVKVYKIGDRATIFKQEGK